KLSGLDVAPVQIAVFCDMATATGKGLGKRTMPETLEYSVVMSIYTLWLAASAAGLGVGWVSILDPESAKACLDVPESWKLIALLCVGYAEEQSTVPELERLGWEKRETGAGMVVRR
ncbi:MAG: nitroreductase family protein, partial [Acidobacteriota bacterium]